MKKISTEFREALRGIRHLSALITYQSEDSTYLLMTENEDNLVTELGDFLGTEKGPVILESTSINSVNPTFEVELFKTFCKSIQIDSKIEIPQKTTINVKIGVLIEEEYEYLDFGNYLVNEVTYQADKDSYLITAYDRMIESMIDYDLDVKYPISIKGLIIEICNKFAWKYDLGNFVNQNKIIEKNVFDEQELTYRDILDQISQVTASSIGFDNETLKIKYISEPDNSTLLPFTIPQVINVKTYSEKLTIDERDLKDNDIDIHEKYGPVNSLLITNNNDIVINNLINQNSIDKNGKSEFQIDNNLILLNDSENYIHEIFEYIDGLEYYLYDVDTFGVLFLDPLDTFYIKIGEMIYPTLMLNDDIKLTTGLVETIFAEKPEISTTEYTATDKNEKKINNALISIDKANGQLILKATSDGKLVQAELSADADSGSEFNVKADNIKLEGYTTINEATKITDEGDLITKNMIAENGSFNGTIKGSVFKGIANNSIEMYIGTSQEDETLTNDNSLKLVRPDNQTLIEIVGKTWKDLSGRNIRTCYFTGDAAYYTFDGNVTVGNHLTVSEYVNIEGNLNVNGTKNRVVNTENYGKRLLNAYETTVPYFGDIGSDITDENGECLIYIENIFKETIETSDYKVLVQECGNGKLYIEKYEEYFIVKGTPNLKFDWEIKAVQKGYSKIRLDEFKQDENNS